MTKGNGGPDTRPRLDKNISLFEEPFAENIGSRSILKGTFQTSLKYNNLNLVELATLFQQASAALTLCN